MFRNVVLSMLDKNIEYWFAKVQTEKKSSHDISIEIHY